MTQPRSWFGRTTLAAAALLAISTLSATAEAASSDQSVTPGPSPRDVQTLGDPVS